MMRYLLILFIVTGLCCRDQRSKVHLGNKSYNDLTGIYQGAGERNKGVCYKLIRINDTSYYYEIYDRDLKKASEDKRFQFGVSIRNGALLNVLNSTAGQYSFKTKSNDNSLTIDSIGLDWYSSFLDIVGNYEKLNSNNVIPNYEYVIHNKWNESQFIKLSKFKLYKYPFPYSDSIEVNANKGEWANTYLKVDNVGPLPLDFFYIALKANEDSLSGWMKESDYFNFLLRVYECERYSNGSVEKWSKEHAYTLYFDSTGKFIRRARED